MQALFFKTGVISSGGQTMTDCIVIKLQVTQVVNHNPLTHTTRLMKTVNKLSDEWGYKKVFLVPFNHLTDKPGDVASATVWQAEYSRVQSALAQAGYAYVALGYTEGKEYEISISVSGDNGSVRNGRFHNNNDTLHGVSKHSHGFGIKFLVFKVAAIHFKIVSPATKPEGIVPQPLRSDSVEKHNELEKMDECLFLFFQVEENCRAEMIELLHQKIIELAKQTMQKNLFISAFGHLTARGALFPHSWNMFENTIQKFENSDFFTEVSYSNFGYNKSFAFTGKCIASGRFASQPTGELVYRQQE